MVEAQTIDDLASAEALAPEWDELAQACSLPLCAPGWMLSWWRHIAPEGSRLCIVAVREHGQLIALAPWYMQGSGRERHDVRFLGAQLSDRVDVLCRDSREALAAPELSRALRELRPRPDLVAFEAVPIGSDWTRLLARAAGPLKMARYRNSAYPAPAVTLGQSAPEAWLAGRSSNFRGQIGRLRRKLEQAGGCVRRITEPRETRRALEAMLTLHRARWRERGESGLVEPVIGEMLLDAATALGPERLRLFAAEIDGEPISVQLFLAAGSEVKYWNGGWAEEHAKLKPSMLTILAALEDAISRGERRLDLGVGRHQYKLRFADSEDTLTWGGVILRNRRWPKTRIELAPRVLRYRAKRAIAELPAGLGDRLETKLRERRDA